MANYAIRLDKDFKRIMGKANRSQAVIRMAEGRISVNHYAWVMRQIFHQARENPQLQAFATMFFHGKQRAMVAPFLEHAAQEIGHDQLALNDLHSLGFDIDEVPYEAPLAATTALTAFAYYQICRGDPVGYLGYLYFLEHMPTASAGQYIELFTRAGVPQNAFSFIREHATVDATHNQWMERYIESLVGSDEAYEVVSQAMEATGYLYTQMVSCAFDAADEDEPTRMAPIEHAQR